MKFTPAATYDLLLIQARALANLVYCMEQQRDAWATDHFASRQLDSERAANEILTNELEAMDRAVSELDIDIRALPKDHPFRQSARRYAGMLAKKEVEGDADRR